MRAFVLISCRSGGLFICRGSGLVDLPLSSRRAILFTCLDSFPVKTYRLGTIHMKQTDNRPIGTSLWHRLGLTGQSKKQRTQNQVQVNDRCRDVHETFWTKTETRRCGYRNVGRDAEAPETLETRESFGSRLRRMMKLIENDKIF